MAFFYGKEGGIERFFELGYLTDRGEAFFFKIRGNGKSVLGVGEEGVGSVDEVIVLNLGIIDFLPSGEKDVGLMVFDSGEGIFWFDEDDEGDPSREREEGRKDSVEYGDIIASVIDNANGRAGWLFFCVERK